jgi:hypothetical protein
VTAGGIVLDVVPVEFSDLDVVVEELVVWVEVVVVMASVDEVADEEDIVDEGVVDISVTPKYGSRTAMISCCVAGSLIFHPTSLLVSLE